MILVSIVTAPFCAKALPFIIVAPVFRVMLWERENIPFERSAGTEGGGAADLPDTRRYLNRHLTEIDHE